ncbi:hypothetical protein P4C99_12820 [Pontiellaceae bacterium B1224]|nr:hypothetical protein [Pontiellaceae bacterium B1224]
MITMLSEPHGGFARCGLLGYWNAGVPSGPMDAPYSASAVNFMADFKAGNLDLKTEKTIFRLDGLKTFQ